MPPGKKGPQAVRLGSGRLVGKLSVAGFIIRGVDHCDRIPGATIQKRPRGPLGCAFAAANTLEGIDLDNSKGRRARILNENHAFIYGAVGLADRRTCASSTGFSDVREHFGLFFAPLGFRCRHCEISPSPCLALTPSSAAGILTILSPGDYCILILRVRLIGRRQARLQEPWKVQERA